VSVLDRLRFYYFHHHHYSDVPEDMASVPATWVVYPNSRYRPEVGHELYKRHMRTIRLAETLGFDGITLNEHHNTVYSMTPTVSLMAAAVIHNTSRVKIFVAGVPVNLEYPNRLAEEYGMLDVMSGGRMEFAFPLGTGMEYWSNSGAVNPTTSRARFRESLEIIKRAWTSDGPQRYDGDFFSYRFLNPWPRPMQKPFPKLFIVGSGSMETIDLAADLEMGYSIVFTPIPVQVAAFDRLRQKAVERGRVLDSDDVAINVVTYVAETDEQADREARPYIQRFWSWFHRVPPKFLLPPGYVSRAEYLRRASDAALAHGTEASYEDMAKIGRVCVGSPDTVADTIIRWSEEAGCSRLNIVLEHADQPEWMTVKNMNMFCHEVIPRIRDRAASAAAAPAAEERPDRVAVGE
jgi:alkanesulfonate monooxygenase SsuD/methylene tetrahydromethanopterin reductase-like flavin-dependent oxidoreductase (luciferase family)